MPHARPISPTAVVVRVVEPTTPTHPALQIQLRRRLRCRSLRCFVRGKDLIDLRQHFPHLDLEHCDDIWGSGGVVVVARRAGACVRMCVVAVGVVAAGVVARGVR